jgi:hypothetical protein
VDVKAGMLIVASQKFSATCGERKSPQLGQCVARFSIKLHLV